MNRTRIIAGIGVIASLLVTSAIPVSAQSDWPQRPITFVVPYAAGGGLDFVARLLAADLEKHLGQSVIVEARPGAGGVIGAQAVAQAEPDGYTWMLAPAGPLVNSPLLTDTVAYDPDADFIPVTKLVVSPIMVLVNGEVEANSLQELVDYGKAHPGELSIGNSGVGSTQQLLSLMFAGGTGTDLNLVAYQGSGQIVPDLLAGRLSMMIDFPAPYSGYFDNGDVRMLATMSGERLESFPDIPTVAEAGFPDVPAWSGWFGMYAPAETPADIIEKMAAASRAYLESDAAVEQLASGGYEPDPASADEVKALMAREREVLSSLIDKYNLRGN